MSQLSFPTLLENFSFSPGSLPATNFPAGQRITLVCRLQNLWWRLGHDVFVPVMEEPVVSQYQFAIHDPLSGCWYVPLEGQLKDRGKINQDIAELVLTYGERAVLDGTIVEDMKWFLEQSKSRYRCPSCKQDTTPAPACEHCQAPLITKEFLVPEKPIADILHWRRTLPTY